MRCFTISYMAKSQWGPDILCGHVDIRAVEFPSHLYLRLLLPTIVKTTGDLAVVGISELQKDDFARWTGPITPGEHLDLAKRAAEKDRIAG